MTTFYLIRHAHADWTPDENRPLSAQGSKDAIRLADTLAKYPVDLICSSPAARARQTIAPFAERVGLQIHVEPDLRERKLGNKNFENFFGAVEVTWRNPLFAHPGGETSAEAQKRGLAIVKRLTAISSDKAIVLSTHGNLMALTLQSLDPSIDFYFWKSMTMPDIYLLKIGSRKPTIQRIWRP